LARYGKSFKNKYVARLLPPLNESPEVVARDAGIAAVTLERWRSEFLLLPASDQSWSGAARLDAVVTTASMDEVSKSAWCRTKGIYPADLIAWQQSATKSLAEPKEVGATPKQAKQDRSRIKDLERELRRKESALAECAALLVLSKKVGAIFRKGEDE
jgi:hypothetical protein